MDMRCWGNESPVSLWWNLPKTSGYRRAGGFWGLAAGDLCPWAVVSQVFTLQLCVEMYVYALLTLILILVPYHYALRCSEGITPLGKGGASPQADTTWMLTFCMNREDTVRCWTLVM